MEVIGLIFGSIIVIIMIVLVAKENSFFDKHWF